MLDQKSFSIEWAGKQLTIATGALAGQADGAVTVRYGDTVILATATMGTTPRAGINYFPLMVDYEERLYAAGKIKGSRFIKREGRPSDEEILTGRLIDRSIRPLFKDTIRNDVQVAILVLSSDMENDADILGLLGASAALAISPIPWGGPLSGVRVGRVGGEWVINPTFEARKKSDLDLLVAGRDQETIMIEAGATEVNEADMVQAIEFALRNLQQPLELIRQMQTEVGQAKRQPEVVEVEAEVATRVEKLKAKVEAFLQTELKGIYDLPAKIAREEAITNIKEKLAATLKEDNEVTKEEREDGLKMVEQFVDAEARRLVLDEGKRVDGRAIDEIRSLSAGVGILPRTHGTGLFQRGETQVLSIVTLGSPGDQQILENIDEAQEFKKHYMHHYYFPGWSVGEVKPNRGPGRREIGHGALAEKALVPVLPDREVFPYTIRVVSEVLSSNGSTSQASTCGSTLALMDAGVPIKRPVAGIAMGLVTAVTEQNGRQVIKRWKVLTDIQGVEDHAGDMDFKVAGTIAGITAIQLDIKVSGITMDIVREAITGARTAREKILAVMTGAIATPRAEMSPYAPRIHVLHIHPDKIRLVIGPGGKMINEITTKTGVTIDIEDDGSVFVTAPDAASSAQAIEMINNITREIEPGEIITGKVSRIMDFGAIVDLTPTLDGMVHISELEPQRVERVSDVLRLGEEVKVKVLSVEDGRISLSIKQVKYPDLPASQPRTGDRDRRRPRF